MPRLLTLVPDRSYPASRPGWPHGSAKRARGPDDSDQGVPVPRRSNPGQRLPHQPDRHLGRLELWGQLSVVRGAPGAERRQRPAVQPRQHPRWGLPDDRVYRRLRGLYRDDAERVRGRRQPVGIPGGRLVVAMAPSGCQHHELPRHHAEHKLHSPRARAVRAAAKRCVRVQLRQIAVAGHS